jgi:uncharacterized protein YbaP (TraB family)
MPQLWTIEVEGDARVRIFGGGPGLAEPWSDAAIEQLVADSDVFWCEVAALEGDVQSLAIKYGVDANAPLATWLSPDDYARTEEAAAEMDVAPQVIAAVRPWLAAQILKMAQETKAGLKAEYSAEQHLERIAKREGLTLRSEFPPGEGVFASFASWPRQTEIERLLSVLDDVEAGPTALHEQAQAWLDDDLAIATKIDERYRRDYPAFYETMILARNQAWVDRIENMLDDDETVFILMGTGHLVGPDGVPALLDRAGISARRV